MQVVGTIECPDERPDGAKNKGRCRRLENVSPPALEEIRLVFRLIEVHRRTIHLRRRAGSEKSSQRDNDKILQDVISSDASLCWKLIKKRSKHLGPLSQFRN